MDVAVDTNLLVRYITRDDPVQEKQAREVMLQHRVFVPKSVVLELEWVLRFTYRFSIDDIAIALDTLLDAEQIDVEDADAVRLAVAAFREGLDFADAMHLVSCPQFGIFLTFDKALFRRASRVFDQPVVRLP